MGESCAMAEALMNAWREFAIDQASFDRIANDFASELAAGLSGGESSLAMMPAFVGRPTGRERGVYLSLDFGGTNVRVAEVVLDGAGGAFIRRLRKVSLKDAAAGYDYTRPEVHVEALFDFLARQLAFLHDGGAKSLGHSFSFVSRQTSLARAALLGCWAKEIRTGGVNGQDIGELLEASLARIGLPDIRQTAVLNDTTATLLTAAYSHGEADLGSVCGTGHNTCHYEPQAGGAVMAYNAEAGGFDRLSFTAVDRALDAGSEHPGRQRLEKMTAGRYLGEVIRRLIHAGGGNCGLGWLAECPALSEPDGFSSQDAALFLADTTKDLTAVAGWLGHAAPGVSSTTAERHFMREAARLAVERAATLVAATYAGFLRRLDPHKAKNHVIGVNGSLYEKMPGFAEGISRALTETGGWNRSQVRFVVTEEAPLVGAAIAASMAEGGGG